MTRFYPLCCIALGYGLLVSSVVSPSATLADSTPNFPDDGTPGVYVTVTTSGSIHLSKTPPTLPIPANELLLRGQCAAAEMEAENEGMGIQMQRFIGQTVHGKLQAPVATVSIVGGTATIVLEGGEDGDVPVRMKMTGGNGQPEAELMASEVVLKVKLTPSVRANPQPFGIPVEPQPNADIPVLNNLPHTERLFNNTYPNVTNR